MLPGGFLGVDAFFAISGFVVTAALCQHRDEPLGAFLAGFYKRRLTRIMPAVLAVLALSTVACVLLIPHSWLSADAERVALFAFAGLANVALTTQASAYFSPRAEFSPFTHTWSLGVEEQFYLVAPVLVFLALRARRFAIPLLFAVSLLSLALCAAWTWTDPTHAFYAITSRFWELAAGALWYLCVWHDQPAAGGSPLVATPAVIAATAAVAFGANTLFEQRQRLSLSAVERDAVDWYANHHDPTLPLPHCAGGGLRYRELPGQLVIEHIPCPAPTEGPSRLRRLYLLGDSHATMLLPMMHRLAIEQSVHVITHQIPSCQYINLRDPMEPYGPTPCSAQARIALDSVLARAEPGDVALLSSLRLPRFGDQWAVGDSDAVIGQHFSATQAGSRQRAVVESDAWIRPLVNRGLHVVLFAPSPIFRAPAFRCVDPWTAGNPVCRHGLSEQRDHERWFRAPMLAALDAVRARHPPGTVSLFDPFDALCPQALCTALTPAGRPLYFDADHLSRFGNQAVYPSFLAHWHRLPAAAPPNTSVAAAPGSRGIHTAAIVQAPTDHNPRR